MAKKAKRPFEQYHIIDNEGWSVTSLAKLSIAKREARQQDKELPQCAPHRVYKLVTLEEVAVIRAAVAAVKSRGKDFRPGVKEWKRLVDAVEASRG